MKFCGSCGARIVDSGAFCGNCGAPLTGAATPATPEPPTAPLPPPVPAATAPVAPTVPITPTEPTPSPFIEPPANRRPGLIVVLALVAMAAIVAVVLALTSGGDDEATATTTSGAIASTTVPAGSTVTTTGGSELTITAAPTTAAPTTTPDPVAAATAQLQQLVATDKPLADGLVGAYVPQLSAKKVGLEADGITYGPVEILADHTRLRSQYGAILVDAGAYDFRNKGQPMTGWYLTIVPVVFDTKDAATQWCTDHGLGPDACFGRQFKPAV